MKKMFKIEFKSTVVSECTVKAESIEEAKRLVEDGEFENQIEVDSYNFEITDAKELD